MICAKAKLIFSTNLSFNKKNKNGLGKNFLTEYKSFENFLKYSKL